MNDQFEAETQRRFQIPLQFGAVGSRGQYVAMCGLILLVLNGFGPISLNWLEDELFEPLGRFSVWFRDGSVGSGRDVT